MKYLAVLYYEDLMRSLENIYVVNGKSGAEELIEEYCGEEESEISYYHLHFYPFQNSEEVLAKFDWKEKEGVFKESLKSVFLSFIGKYEPIYISEMDMFEDIGFYRRSSGFCSQCGKDNSLFECECPLNDKIGLTVIN